MQGAVRRVTQRVNLFEKVLIPNAKQNIARIQIFLSDVERAAVVTSKIAKAKRAQERASAEDVSQGDALMSIVPLIKVTLYGPAAEKDAVLDGLQSLGCLHLNDLRPGAAEAVDLEPSYPDARQALQYLRDSPVRRRTPRHRENVDVEAVVKEVLDVRDRSRSLAEEREQLRKWIADLEPWGDFELPEWAQEGALRFWFYMVPHHQMRAPGGDHPPLERRGTRPSVCVRGGHGCGPTCGHAGAPGAARAALALEAAPASGTG